MKDKVVIVTGANSGIGAVAALELAKKGATVVMLCRNEARGEKARADIIGKSRNDSVHLMLCDLASQREIRGFADRFRQEFDRLDVLLNNAGLTRPKRTLTEDGIEMVFAVNHLAYFLLTNLLLDVLGQSAPSRIVNVASEAHRGARVGFDDLQMERGYGVWEAYRRSKLCNLLFTYELARRLKDTGVTVNAVHPGTVRTNLWRNAPRFAQPLLSLAKPFMRLPEKGAETLVWLASSPQVEGMSGKYFMDLRQAQSSPLTYDQEPARRLWEASERLTGAWRAQ